MYQGAVRDFKEVTKSLDSIGPEVIQTLSVSTIHNLLFRCKKVALDNEMHLLRSFFVNAL